MCYKMEFLYKGGRHIGLYNDAISIVSNQTLAARAYCLPRSTASSSLARLRPVASIAVGRGEIREEAEAGGGGDPSEPQEHVTTKKWLLPDVRN